MSEKTMMIVRDPHKPVYRLLLVQKIKEELRPLGWRVKFCDGDPVRVAARIAAKRPDILLSISFDQRLSLLAASVRLPYFCWEYDKIMNPELFKTRYYSPYTYFFATYLGDVRRLQSMGVKSLYLPAVPPIDPVSTLTLTDEERDRYGCDISFVGSSVIKVTNSFLQLQQLLLGDGQQASDPTKKVLWELVLGAVTQQEEFTRESRYCLPELLVEAVKGSSFGAALHPEVLLTFLGKECCRFQRLYFLDALRQFQVRVYGSADWQQANLAHVTYGGHLSYENAAPRVFQASKINLNIARIYSMDGMSDRVTNVLSVGGFLLSNGIEEITQCFEPGKELVVFHTAKELQEACSYYLAHEQERRDIAERGQARVARDHTVAKRLETMFDFMARFPVPII